MSGGQRVGAIDIGTNTVLLLVAEGPSRAPRAVVERATITRLGEGVDRNRVLGRDAMSRTLECLEAYAALLRTLAVGRVEAVATSAARDALNGDEFLDRARTILGADVRVVGGAEEARLTFEGAVSGLPPPGPVTVFDVGGGSTELIRGVVTERGASLETAASLEIGSVRLTERYVKHDPPLREEVDAVRAEARAALAGLPFRAESSTALVGVAGTVTTLAAIDQGLTVYDGARVHGSVLPSSAVLRLLESLGSVPLPERRRTTGLEAARADVIVAGTALVSEIVAWSGATEVLVSDRGVRWGLVLRALRPCP